MSMAIAPANDGLEPERKALIRIDPPGTYIRHPPQPHELDCFITPDSQLFQTIHMGSAVVDLDAWRLVVTGLVERQLSVSFSELTNMTTVDLTSFHECYGPPAAAPTKNYWRIGNVTWTGVRLSAILAKAGVSPSAQYIWSEGLDHGEFAGHRSRKYQKDLTVEKAMGDECLVVWKMNGEPLTKNRGGPVRLIVPGWFGTNSTKWLCRLEVRDKRAKGTIFTTRFYNEIDPRDTEERRMRPVWEVEANSFITRPKSDELVKGPNVNIEGWCWSCDGIESVQIHCKHGGDPVEWKHAQVEPRKTGRWNWQRFRLNEYIPDGEYEIAAKATCRSGQVQPPQGRRNHCHALRFRVQAPEPPKND